MILYLQLVCDKHFFFNYNIHMRVIQNSMLIYICPIYLDQKHSIEFHAFKFKIFTNIRIATFCFIFS